MTSMFHVFFLAVALLVQQELPVIEAFSRVPNVYTTSNRKSSTWISMTEPDLLTRSEAIVRTIGLPVSAAVAFRTGAAVAVIDQPRMPDSLPGPYTCIGSRVIRLPAEGSGKGARVRIFYPSEQSSGEMTMAPYCTDGRTTSDGMAGLVGFRQLGLSFLLGHLAEASSGCYQDAPFLTSKGEKFPLLVYSHGYGGNMDMSTYLFRAVASTGVIVAAVEHGDGTASYTKLSDGTDLPFSPSFLSSSEQLERRAQELLAATDLNALPTEFASVVDPKAIFLGGHSYGGPSALLAASRATLSAVNNAPIAGLILHDPALSMGSGMLGDLQSLYKAVPTISYTSDEYNAAGVSCGNLTVHVRGAFHGNFVDAPLWAPVWVMRPLSSVIPAAGPANPVKVHSALARSAAAFVQSRDASYGPPTATGDAAIFELRS